MLGHWLMIIEILFPEGGDSTSLAPLQFQVFSKWFVIAFILGLKDSDCPKLSSWYPALSFSLIVKIGLSKNHGMYLTGF